MKKYFAPATFFILCVACFLIGSSAQLLYFEKDSKIYDVLFSAVATFAAAYFASAVAHDLYLRREESTIVARDVAAGNLMIFNLIAWHYVFAHIKTSYKDNMKQIADYRELRLLPFPEGFLSINRINFSSLSFIFSGKNPEVMRKLMALEMNIFGSFNALVKYSKMHSEILQPAMAEIAKRTGNDSVYPDQIIDIIGRDNHGQLKSYCDIFLDSLDEDIKKIISTIKEARSEILSIYPGNYVLNIEFPAELKVPEGLKNDHAVKNNPANTFTAKIE